MFKEFLTIAIAGLLIQAVCLQPAFAASKAEKEALRAEKVKAGILKLGVGTDARVAIKLRDDAKLAGYISEANEGSFVVTNPKTRSAMVVAYGDVSQVKGHNLGTGAKVAIGIGIGVGLTILVLWLIFLNYQD
jgi:hypothetical protein